MGRHFVTGRRLASEKGSRGGRVGAEDSPRRVQSHSTWPAAEVRGPQRPHRPLRPRPTAHELLGAPDLRPLSARRRLCVLPVRPTPRYRLIQWTQCALDTARRFGVEKSAEKAVAIGIALYTSLIRLRKDFRNSVRLSLTYQILIDFYLD